MTWKPSLQLLADETHILLGTLAVSLAVLFGFAWYWGATLILAFAALKELGIDPLVEGDTFLPPGTGLRDFVGYAFGVSIGFVITTVVFPFLH